MEQVPKFKALLTEDEFKHIEAFPSILRLLGAGPLRDELLASDKSRMDKIEGISFTRVMDNGPLFLNKDEFWAHLNFHLIHTLDFLPCEDWAREAGDNFIFGMRKVYVNLKPAFPNSTTKGRQGTTLGGFIRDWAPG